MNWGPKMIRIALGLLTIVFLLVVYARLPDGQKTDYQMLIQKPLPIDHNLKVVQESFYRELSQMKHLSDEDSKEIAALIPIYAKKYDIDSAVLFGVLWKESRFQHTVEHKPTNVKALGKTVQAIGIGGIVYEFWGSKLEAAGIIKEKEDLYLLDKGIESSAFVLSELKKLGPLKGHNLTDSMLHRYYGASTKHYAKKVISKANEIKKNTVDFLF